MQEKVKPCHVFHIHHFAITLVIAELLWHVTKRSNRVACYIHKLQIFICSINQALKNLRKNLVYETW